MFDFITIPQKKDIHVFGRPLGLLILILYKFIWGTIEIIAGLFLLFSNNIISEELIEDPQDIFVQWIFAHFGLVQAHRIGAFIVLLGTIKVIMAFGIWYRSWAVRNIAIIFFCVVGIFGIYQILASFTIFKLGALIMDIILLWYVWKRLPQHLHHRKIA